MVVVGGGPKPPLRELSPVLPRHVRLCGELRILAAPPDGVTGLVTKLENLFICEDLMKNELNLMVSKKGVD